VIVLADGAIETEPDVDSSTSAARHLLAVPTDSGRFMFIEQMGSPPPVGTAVAVHGFDGQRWHVGELARSPLSDDPRVCAYLRAGDPRMADRFRETAIG
jgi:hypothetical protein